MKLLKLIVIFSLIFTPITSHSGAASTAGLAAGGYLAYKAATTNAVTNSAAYKAFKKGCPWTCALAVAAAAMVVVSLTTAKKARGVSNELECAQTNSCFNNSNGDDPNSNNNGNNGNLNPNNPGDRALVDLERERPELERFLQEKEKDGYKVNRQTGAVTDPNGKTLKSAADAMSSGGMNAQQRAEAEKILAEAAREGQGLAKSLEEYDEEFGGGGESGVATGGYNSGSSGSSRLGVPASTVRQPSVAGLSVNHGADQIGVAGDNIFDMIHRRYETTKPGMNPNPTGP